MSRSWVAKTEWMQYIGAAAADDDDKDTEAESKAVLLHARPRPSTGANRPTTFMN